MVETCIMKLIHDINMAVIRKTDFVSPRIIGVLICRHTVKCRERDAATSACAVFTTVDGV